MRKTSYFIAFIYCLFLLVSFKRSPVFAQELAPTNWQCMSVKQTGGHTASLTTKEGSFFAPYGSNVYIVECVSSSAGNACSTGNTGADSVLGLSGMPGYSISNSFANPVKATIDGKTEGEPHSRTTDGPDSNHVYFGVQLTKDTVLSVSDATQKFGSFYPTNSDTNCVSLRWDPTGIVFDSKTLEPIPGVGITIYNKDGSKLNLAGVPNPYNTRENGQYNFNVEPNKFYSMTAQSTIASFPTSKSILPAQNDPDFPYTGIYKGGLFFETPKILRLDIPVDSTIPFVRDVKITDWKSRLDKPLNLLIIDGGLTHPFSKIKVFNASKLVGIAIADQYGKFIVSVETTVIDNTQDLELTTEKAGVYNRVQNIKPSPKQNLLMRSLIDKLIPQVNAQTSGDTIKIKPILNYLEGYAFDENGEVIPNATIQIILTVATKPSYQTKADDKGYFRISSEYIPPLPYNIVIISPSGQTVTLSTTQFASYNKEKSQDKQTSFGQYRTVSNSYTTPASEPDSLTATNSGTNNSGMTGNSGDNVNTGNQTSGEKPTETKNNSLISFLLIILLTVSAGCALFLYKKKKTIKENTKKTSDQKAS